MKQNKPTPGWLPPVSPYGLIQETLWPDGWKILVACIMLNCTTRRAAEKVIPKVFRKYPTAEELAEADPEELSKIIAELGFKNKRTRILIEFSKNYCVSNWQHPKDLPGIGDYAGAAWDIFMKGEIPKECPKDGALANWWRWMKRHNSM